MEMALSLSFDGGGMLLLPKPPPCLGGTPPGANRGPLREECRKSGMTIHIFTYTVHLLKYIYILQVWVYVKAYLVHVCISLYFIHGLFSLHHQHTYHTHPMVVAALLLSTGKALLLSIKTLNLLLSCCFPSSWSLRPPPELPRAQLEKPMPRSVTSLLSPVPDWIKK